MRFETASQVHQLLTRPMRGRTVGGLQRADAVRRGLINVASEQGNASQLHPAVDPSSRLVLRAAPHKSDELFSIGRSVELHPTGAGMAGEKHLTPMTRPRRRFLNDN